MYKPKSKIAYICTGYDHRCSLAPGCFLREDLVANDDMVCHHTTDPEYAVNGPCTDPENHPERFVCYHECEWDEDPKWYELLPEEKDEVIGIGIEET